MTSTADSRHIRALVVVGPTAVGKTAFAEKIALRLGGEIVSADSMQVYRGLDIGTAKPPADERSVAYHCLDLVEPGAPFSAALFQHAARRAIADIAVRGRLPIVAGGTGLYVRAAVDAMEFPHGVQTDNPVRESYERYAQTLGAPALHALLAQRDAASAAVIHPNNTRRVIRALEMADEGVSYAEQRAGLARFESVYDARFVGLTMDRERLYDRIDRRVDEMLARGLLGEVERLLKEGLRDALTASQAIGYKEFVPVIESGGDLDAAVAAVKQASRRYAKRQLTWFRSDPRITWFDVTGNEFETLTDEIVGTLDWSVAPAPAGTATHQP